MNNYDTRTGQPLYQMESKFTGNILGYIGRALLGTLLTAVTFGIMAPWAIVLINRWEIENTYIEGRRLRFEGTATSLFLNYIKWWFFTIITFGIYGFWLHIKVRQWVVKNTYFA